MSYLCLYIYINLPSMFSVRRKKKDLQLMYEEKEKKKKCMFLYHLDIKDCKKYYRNHDNGLFFLSLSHSLVLEFFSLCLFSIYSKYIMMNMSSRARSRFVLKRKKKPIRRAVATNENYSPMKIRLSIKIKTPRNERKKTKGKIECMHMYTSN